MKTSIIVLIIILILVVFGILLFKYKKEGYISSKWKKGQNLIYSGITEDGTRYIADRLGYFPPAPPGQVFKPPAISYLEYKPNKYKKLSGYHTALYNA